MLRSSRRWLAVVTLAACCWPPEQTATALPVPFQESAMAQAKDVLRTLVDAFFATYLANDLEGHLRLWAPRSPGLAARREALQYLFSEYEQLVVKDLSVRRVE